MISGQIDDDVRCARVAVTVHYYNTHKLHLICACTEGTCLYDCGYGIVFGKHADLYTCKRIQCVIGFFSLNLSFFRLFFSSFAHPSSLRPLDGSHRYTTTLVSYLIYMYGRPRWRAQSWMSSNGREIRTHNIKTNKLLLLLLPTAVYYCQDLLANNVGFFFVFLCNLLPLSRERPLTRRVRCSSNSRYSHRFANRYYLPRWRRSK